MMIIAYTVLIGVSMTTAQNPIISNVLSDIYTYLLVFVAVRAPFICNIRHYMREYKESSFYRSIIVPFIQPQVNFGSAIIG